jgi:hypothetical protein
LGSGKRIGILNAQVHATSMRIEFSTAEKIARTPPGIPKNCAQKIAPKNC